VPRSIYGDYIASLIEPYCGSGDGGGSLEIVRDECLSLTEDAKGVTVQLKAGGAISADVAVLATGHPESAQASGCHADPWTPPPEAGVRPDDAILVLGTGLTMVDYVIALQLSGHRGPIFAISRRGLLPHVHRTVTPLVFDERDIPFGQSISKLTHWLRRQARDRVADGGDWRDVVDGIRPYTQRLWQSLTQRDRRRFLEHARPWWDVHRHRMAPAAAGRINAALGSGQLKVIAAKVVAIEERACGAHMRYRRRGGNDIESMDVAKIVECKTASELTPATENPLLQSLFERGAVRSDPLQIGLAVTPDCRVLSKDGLPSQRIYAAGPLTRAAFWEIVAIPDIRNQCAALAAGLRRQAIR